jgi:hypothetical protein
MSTTYGDTRWWENYAVRYLMPSVAGVAIVKWISWHGGGKLLSGGWATSVPSGLRSRKALSPVAGIVTTGGARLLALLEEWFLSAAGGKGFVTVRWCALSRREFHHAATLPS